MPEPATVLCILDGFGLNPNAHGNAVAQARKPNFDRLWAECPHNTLITFGERVGLPAGQMGNSEVGHLNIGAGRVVEQWLLRISRALAGDFMEKSPQFKAFCASSNPSAAVHLVGLLSTGGVHSHSDHLKLLIAKLSSSLPAQIYLHLITDGRDCSPFGAASEVKELTEFIRNYPRVSIKSLCGRFFAMDRDKRWERTQHASNCLWGGQGEKISDPVQYIQDSYARGVTDEFLEPAVLDSSALRAEDSVVFWNFREDRMRQIVAASCLSSFGEFKPPAQSFNPARVLCFTDYDHKFGLPFLFEQTRIQNHIGEVVSRKGFKQLRVAETEKYPHVTYFFNGGVEPPLPGEERTIIPSPRDVKTYDQKPEMSAAPVCGRVVDGVRSGEYRFIVVNFANCDMVGHTGNLAAAIRAVQTVDGCLGQIRAALESTGGKMLVIADHGNAEYMVNDDGTPNTAHTTFPVPVVLFGEAADIELRDDGALCDVAPTLLRMMGLEKPAEMAGSPLY